MSVLKAYLSLGREITTEADASRHLCFEWVSVTLKASPLVTNSMLDFSLSWPLLKHHYAFY